MAKIGIVGSRRRNTKTDMAIVRLALTSIYQPGDIIVSGGCPKGADYFAEELAEEFHAETIIHRPDKTQLDPYLLKVNPRAAWAIINYARNTLIAQDSDVLIACVAPDRRGGTEDTLKKFKKFHPTRTVILV